jgi:hypothetical protein
VASCCDDDKDEKLVPSGAAGAPGAAGGDAGRAAAAAAARCSMRADDYRCGTARDSRAARMPWRAAALCPLEGGPILAQELLSMPVQ